MKSGDPSLRISFLRVLDNKISRIIAPTSSEAQRRDDPPTTGQPAEAKHENTPKHPKDPRKHPETTLKAIQ